MNNQIEYPWLARLSRWIDQAHEFLNLINGGVLWLGLAISLGDVLTDQWFTLSFGWLLIVWAVSQAIGVDSFIYHLSARARHHFDKKDWIPLVITAAVVGALGYVAWQAAYIFGASQVDHISISDAINSLGISSHDWLKLRFAGSVAMVMLSGFTRYAKAPAKGAVAVQGMQQQPVSVQPVIVDAGPVEAPETPQETPTVVPANVRSIESATASRSHSGKRQRSYIHDPRYILAAASFTRDNPGSSVKTLARHLGVSEGTAQQLRQIARAQGEAVWDLYDEIPAEEAVQ